MEPASAIGGVWAVEPLGPRPITRAQLGVTADHFRTFVADPFPGADAVPVPTLDHEPTRLDEQGHLGVVESVGEVPLEDLVLAGEEVTAGILDPRILPHPLVKI